MIDVMMNQAPGFMQNRYLYRGFFRSVSNLLQGMRHSMQHCIQVKYVAWMAALLGRHNSLESGKAVEVADLATVMALNGLCQNHFQLMDSLVSA